MNRAASSVTFNFHFNLSTSSLFVTNSRWLIKEQFGQETLAASIGERRHFLSIDFIHSIHRDMGYLKELGGGMAMWLAILLSDQATPGSIRGISKIYSEEAMLVSAKRTAAAALIVS